MYREMYAGIKNVLREPHTYRGVHDDLCPHVRVAVVESLMQQPVEMPQGAHIRLLPVLVRH